MGIATAFYLHMFLLALSLFLILTGLHAVREIIGIMRARRQFRLALSRALGMKL
jgi:hypothetical protein